MVVAGRFNVLVEGDYKERYGLVLNEVANGDMHVLVRSNIDMRKNIDGAIGIEGVVFESSHDVAGVRAS